MKVLSLFNGISGCHLALDKAGIQVDQVYYSEIDKYANQVTQHHYPDDISLGDVTKWQEWDVDWSSIDLVTAGFPCQAWSVAGKQLGDKDERGMLFWTTLEIIAHVLKHNPSAKFLMENVKMKKDFEQYITHHTEQALGHVEKTLINSALVSAQNRQRYYWTNFEVTQPEDKKIITTSIIDFYDGCSFPSSCDRDRNFTKKKKFNTLTASYYKGIRATSRPAISKRESNYDMDRHAHRMLTPIECERLQTFPDNWTDCISNTQRYKCLGNGWTIEVISHIFKCAFKESHGN